MVSWPKILDRARARRRQANQAAQRGGLAGAVAAQQGGHLPLRHLQPDIVQDVALAVEGVQALGDQRVHSRGPQIGGLHRGLFGDFLRRAFRQRVPLSEHVMRSARLNTTRMSCSISTMV